MIKLMIVEDDMLTRIGLVSLLKAGREEFQIVAEADNGKTALEMAEQLKPDIIITDVEMPVMDGITLIREAKRKGLEARFVILSSYNQFEYVREGMKLGAVDYLLKLELDQEKLTSLLCAIPKENNHHDTVHQNNDQNRYTRYRISEEHLKSKCIFQILTGKFAGEEEIAEKLREAKLDIPQKNLLCVVAKRSYLLDDKPGSATSLKKILTVLNSWINNFGKGYGCIAETNLFAMVLSLPDKNINDFVLEYCNKIRQNMVDYIQKVFGITLQVKTGRLVDGYAKLPQSFRHLLNSVESPGTSKEAGGESDEAASELCPSFEQELSLIDTVLSCYNTNDIGTAFNTLITAINQFHSIPLKILHGVCYTLIHFADRFTGAGHGDFAKGSWSRSNEMLYLIKNCKNREDYIGYIKHLSELLQDIVCSQQESEVSILKARNYIKQNYHKNISLESVAAYVNLNPTYFSRLFSQETNTSFVNYLKKIRIDNAKSLLKNTNKRVQEISEEIGYNNAYYFSRVFKQETGKTPLAYRTQSRNI